MSKKHKLKEYILTLPNRRDPVMIEAALVETDNAGCLIINGIKGDFSNWKTYSPSGWLSIRPAHTQSPANDGTDSTSG